MFLSCVCSTPCQFYGGFRRKKTNGELGVRLECQPTSCMCFDSWIKFEELMLNAVALNAILDVDEFLGS